MTTFSILGTGGIGGALASHFARKSIPVRVASRSRAKKLADKLGGTVRATTVVEALTADIVFLAIPYAVVPDVVGGAKPWNGRIVVDATNLLVPVSELHGGLSTETIASLVPGARVVKGFNTLYTAVLADDPVQHGAHRVVFLSGDDDGANTVVAKLVEQLGFAPVLLGRLSEGGRLQHFGGSLVGLNLLRHPDQGR